MINRISLQFRDLVRWSERLLALVVLIGAVVYGIGSAQVMAGMD